MGKGLPKWAIKKAQAAGAKNVFAYAWSLVKKTGKKAPKSLKTSSRKSKSSGSRKMARRRIRSRRRRGGMTIPIAPIIGLAAGMAVPVQKIMAGQAWGVAGGIDNLIAAYTGIIGTMESPPKPRFDAIHLMNGLLPLIAGVLVHKFVGGKLGVNAMLARAEIPFIRI